MTTKLLLDESSDVPIYQQIIDRIEEAILSGRLKTGEFLPSVRDFSVNHQVNPNTISKAYQALQSLGLAEQVRGLGLRVTSLDNGFSAKRKREILMTSIDSLIAVAISLHVTKEDLVQELKERMKTKYRPVEKRSPEAGSIHD